MGKSSLQRGLGIAAAVAAAALGGAVIAAFTRDLREARARLVAGSVIDTAAGPIEYATAGDGPPVLIVHGAGGGFDQGLDIGAELARGGMRVIAMSRFGYLRTPLPADASAAAQADAHAALLDALEIRRASILGASAGGPSALQFALRHKERTSALVLLAPAAYAPRQGGAPPVRTPPGVELLFSTALRSDFLMWAATRAAPHMLTGAILGTPPELVRNAGANEQARIARMLAHILPVTARRIGLQNDAAVTASLERYDLEAIAAPTLVLSAADDLYGTYEIGRYTADHIRGARFVGYESGGHLLVGQEAKSTAEILAFLLANR
jgi:pimeloyl-ACP methyl ester carboxylesterase